LRTVTKQKDVAKIIGVTPSAISQELREIKMKMDHTEPISLRKRKDEEELKPIKDLEK